MKIMIFGFSFILKSSGYNTALKFAKAFFESNGEFPSLYVITPFVTVKNELLKLFYDNLWQDIGKRAMNVNKNRLYH